MRRPNVKCAGSTTRLCVIVGRSRTSNAAQIGAVLERVLVAHGVGAGRSEPDERAERDGGGDRAVELAHHVLLPAAGAGASTGSIGPARMNLTRRLTRGC